MSLKTMVLKGFFWTSIDKFGVQIVQLILGIIIARILSPEDYGTVALLSVFFALSEVFIDSGFGKALIQYNNPSAVDYSTVFFFNLLISILCYLILYFSAPFIADFYNIPILKKLTRIMTITLIINSFIIIPNSIFNIQLNFKPIAVARGISTVVGGGVGVFAAYNGDGLWALVYMSIVSSSLFVIIQCLQLQWLPIFKFSIISFKKLYHYGSKLFLAAILDSLVSNISSIAIGKLFDAKSLGFYSRGVSFSSIASNTVISVLYSVLFPAFSSIKDDHERLLLFLKKSMRYTALFVFPIFMLGSILSKPLIVILLTDKWLIASTILQYLILARMINMVALINVQVILAIGRSDITLKQDIGKMVVKICFLAAAFKFGIVWIAIAELFATLINFFINTYASGKIFKFGAINQMKEFGDIFVFALTSALLSLYLMTFFENNYSKIFFATISLFTVYIALLRLFKQKDFIEIKSLIFNKLRNRNSCLKVK